MSDTHSDNQIFDFNHTFAELVAQDGPKQQTDAAAANEDDLRQALKAAGEAAYRWNIETDEILWSANAPEVLGSSIPAISTGKLFASLLDIENVTTRYETVMNSKARDDGRGVPFQIEYLFRSLGRNNSESIWLEDAGRWQTGLDGIPKTVFGTVRRIDERHRQDQHLNFIGNCDPLTGMMNRGRMNEALGEAISVAKKTDGNCAFAIASVNNLPIVNEAYGFEVADEVIVAVGRRLRQAMRNGDGIARYSGGKFGIILNDCDVEELNIAMSRYLSVIRDNVIETTYGPVWATLSIGAIELPKQASDPNMATSRAEEALNEARKLPSDDFVVYQPSERRKAERQLNARCATEIVKCLKEDRFKLAFQPIVDVKTGKPAFHEALLRMQEASGSELIAATHLIPIAEQLGLVRLVDRAVLQLIVQTLHAHPQAMLSMNVSASTATDPHWYEQLLDVIRDNEKAASRLTVEITETVALSDLKSTRHFVDQLRKAGCSVAIDDFGAGYTSFRNLRELPVNILKLDGSFCQNIAKNADNQYMAQSLIDLSAKFNLKSVAEWVETAEDAALLKDWGIDYLQGNFLGAASVVAPWGAPQTNTFEMSSPGVHESIVEAASDLSNIEVFSFTVPILQSFGFENAAEAEFEKLADVMQERPQQKLPEGDSSNHSNEMPPTESSNEAHNSVLSFSDIDNSIANLRAALSELTVAKEQPAPENIEVAPEEVAA